MTTKDLRAIDGFSEMYASEPFRKLMAYLQENCPFVGRDVPDATQAIRNEGRLQGWLQLLSDVRGINQVEKTPEKEVLPRPLYQDPDKLPEPVRK